MSDAFAVGKQISARIDAGLSDDLRILARAGWTATDVVREAVRIFAEIHINAWQLGGYPEGARPTIVGATLAPYDSTEKGV